MLQRLLGIPHDGSFGPATTKALMTAQRKHGLVPDGICGPKSWTALFRRRQISVREEVIPVETWQILVTVGVPSGIFGFAVWLIERKIEQHERKRTEEAKKRENIEAQREKSREELQICIYETSLAAIALGEANRKGSSAYP